MTQVSEKMETFLSEESRVARAPHAKGIPPPPAVELPNVEAEEGAGAPDGGGIVGHQYPFPPDGLGILEHFPTRTTRCDALHLEYLCSLRTQIHRTGWSKISS